MYVYAICWIFIHSIGFQCVDSRGGDKKRSLDSAEADSACFLRMQSPKSFFIGEGRAVEEFFFFLIFFAHLKLMVASIFLAKFHGGFALLTQH